jgi:hypothetical protein
MRDEMLGSMVFSPTSTTRPPRTEGLTSSPKQVQLCVDWERPLMTHFIYQLQQLHLLSGLGLLPVASRWLSTSLGRGAAEVTVTLSSPSCFTTYIKALNHTHRLSRSPVLQE